MEPTTLALIAIGGAALLGGKGGGGRAGSSSGWAIKGKEGRAKMLNEVRNMSFYYSKTFNSMPLLADYLTVVGFIESNFNPAATNPEVKSNPMNAARGLFGMRPETAFKNSNGLKGMRSSPNTLLNPRWAFVTAVDYVAQGCYQVDRDLNRGTNFAAVRRWWARPALIKDFDYSGEHSKVNLQRFQDGIASVNKAYGTNVNPEFIWQTISGWRNYPGMDTMRKAYGL